MSAEPRATARWRTAAVLAAPAVVGTIALLIVTRKGVYASPDSAFYVGTARNLLDGQGLTPPHGSPPLSHFPPLFGLVLAAAGWVTGLDPLDAAGVVNPLLLGVTAGVVAVVVRRRSGSVAVGVAASSAVVVGVDLLVYFASALSEPLFIALVVGAVVALAAALDDGRRGAWAAAVVLTAGACLTRYVGVALVVAGAGVLLRLGHRRRAALFAALSLAPLAAWTAVAGRGNRPVVVHLFDGAYWLDGLRSLSRWVLPPSVAWPVRALALALVAAGVARLAIRPSHPRPELPEPDALGLLLSAFTLAYLALLVADRVLFDVTGRLDLRFLAVLHVVAVLGLAPWLARSRPAVAVALGLLALQAAYSATWVASGLTDTSVGRRGLTSDGYDDSPVMAAVAALPPDVTLSSNAPEAVFLLTGREAESLPAHTDHLSGRRRPAYGAELAAVEGVVVWLRPYAFRERFLAAFDDLPVTTLLADDVAILSSPVDSSAG